MNKKSKASRRQIRKRKLTYEDISRAAGVTFDDYVLTIVTSYHRSQNRKRLPKSKARRYRYHLTETLTYLIDPFLDRNWRCDTYRKPAALKREAKLHRYLSIAYWGKPIVSGGRLITPLANLS